MLSEEKIKKLFQDGDYCAVVRSCDIVAFARAIEAAVLAELAKQEPVAYCVFDQDNMPGYCAPVASMCHEYINDAINEHDIDDAAKWKVIPLFAAPVVLAEQAKAGPVAWVDTNGQIWGNGAAIAPGDSLFLHPAPAPEGMVMVPREPTEAMEIAGTRFKQLDPKDPVFIMTDEAGAIYRAMIAAAEKEQSNAG